LNKIEKLYLTDPERTKLEIEAARMALRVYGDTAEAMLRNRVIQAFLLFRSQHPPLAGLVAAELAKWNSWESRRWVDPARIRDAAIRHERSHPSVEVTVTPDTAPSR
jgi:hypothetical protein